MLATALHFGNFVTARAAKSIISSKCVFNTSYGPEHNTSVCKYWKIQFYPSNTDTGTFYGGSTDTDTDVQYPKFNTDILVFPVSVCYVLNH